VSVHRSWVEPGLTLLNTATTESFRAVRRYGAAASRVRCVGLPVDERFAFVATSPEALRADLDLDPGRFTVLLVGGGEGAGWSDDLSVPRLASLDSSRRCPS